MANKDLVEKFQISAIELFALSALVIKDSYPYRITVDLKKLSFGLIDYNVGNLYPIFARLLTENMITSYMIDGADGKEPRAWYHIEDKGKKYLIELKNEYNKFLDISQLILKSNGCWKGEIYTVNKELFSKFQRSATEFFTLSLLTENDSHPYRVAVDLKKRTCGLIDYSIGGLYPAFSRLLKDNMISSYTVENHYNDAPKTVYHIEEAGIEYFNQSREKFDKYVCAFSMIVEYICHSIQKSPGE